MTESNLSTSLSPQELCQLRKSVARAEQWNGHWHVIRWAMLLVGIAGLTGAILTFTKMEQLAAQSSYEALGLEQSKLVDVVEAMVDVKASLLRTEIKMYIGLIVSGASGLAVIILAVFSWREPLSQRMWLPLAKHVLKANSESTDT